MKSLRERFQLLRHLINLRKLHILFLSEIFLNSLMLVIIFIHLIIVHNYGMNNNIDLINFILILLEKTSLTCNNGNPRNVKNTLIKL